ncbi:MAG: tRNA (adenosine(37)-N6)-threonylcarbamoyltransferase complex transferase subunit TsaD [Ignavibacteriae bacterium]|nr:tRNA (adenosine(37)-N6)-threonylcarbamoyltransferase complex transferase subunit TsaD [Ignavibacteriota bacterium]NOG99121.1 tRNA (adenosine(37)-N6)-threonylcarbamoyltransferase complex transferase subunit TsaD [Ignavibacteriota bacterium]
MNTLGIETSCDETSIAIISDGELRANLISSQDFHAKYGGVVPELSSRAHLQIIQPLLRQALDKSKIKLEEIDLICSTAGPGLIGALLVGLSFGKSLSYSLNKPFVPVNHIEGHIYSGFLMNEKPEYPYLCLVVSGGHTLLLIVKSETEIIKLGSTIDDAVGEAFDKVAKMMGLPYPGGPSIQSAAEKGNDESIKFPIARLKTEFDFSFSGLKTSVLRYLQKNYGMELKIKEADIPNIAASFQKTVVESLKKNVEKALDKYEVKTLSLVGGVAANKAIRNMFDQTAKKYNKKIVIPDNEFCGDNAAMIAARGEMLHNAGMKFSLESNAFARLKVDHFTEIL